MLSVQTAGCAGMERLGVPTRTSLSTPSDDRGQFTCRMRVDAIQARELLAVRGDAVILSNTGNNGSTINNTNHQQHQQQAQQHNNHTQQIHQQQQQQQQQHQQLQQQQQQQHSHRNQYHHQQQQTQQQTHYRNQTQHYLRMTTPNNTSVGGNLAKRSNSNSNSNSDSASSNIVRGGIEATTLKYGNTGSGNKAAGGGTSPSSGSSNSSTSSSSYSYNNYSNSSLYNEHPHAHAHTYNKNQQQQQQTLRCPYHVPLPPDTEWGQLRTAYQQSEITRSYITPAPNKTIKDVPEQSHYSYLNLTQQQQQQQHFNSPSPTPAMQQQPAHAPHQHNNANTQQQNKSKSVITKLFSRKSSPKSPTSSLSSLSTSSSLASSASLLSTATLLATGISTAAAATTSIPTATLNATPLTTLPISTATTLKTTPCSYGATTAPHTIAATSGQPAASATASTHHLMVMGMTVPITANTMAAMERIPTPPLAVLVPIPCHTQAHTNHGKTQEQQMLHDGASDEHGHSAGQAADAGMQPGRGASPNASCETLALPHAQAIADNASCMPGRSVTGNRANNNFNILNCSCHSKHCDICNPPAHSIHNQ